MYSICVRQPYVKKLDSTKLKLPSWNERMFVWAHQAHQAYECTLHIVHNINRTKESTCERNETYMSAQWHPRLRADALFQMDVLSWDRIKYNGESIRCPEPGEHGLRFGEMRDKHTRSEYVSLPPFYNVVGKHFELGRLQSTFADAISAELRKRLSCTPMPNAQTKGKQTIKRNGKRVGS